MSDFYFGPILDYIFGIILSIVAAAMFTGGAILQKRGTEQLSEKGIELNLANKDSLISAVKNRIWAIGILLGALGGLPYFASQILIGVTLTQPLQGTGLLMLVILAVYYLKETLRKQEIIGIAILIAGPIFLAFGGVQDIPSTLPMDFRFILSLIIFYVLCISGIILTYYLAHKKYKPAAMLAVNSGIFFGMGAISAQIGNFFLELNLGIPSILGVIFGYLMIFIGNAIGTLVANMAFQKGKAVRVIPVQAVGNLLIPVVGGVLIFLQVVSNPVLFIIGLCFQLGGGLLIVRLQAKMQDTTTTETILEKENEKELDNTKEE